MTRVQKPRDVDYTLETLDEEDLPDLEVQRRSPLTDQINRIINEPHRHGNKFTRIGSYANGSAASSAAKGLRYKYGDKEEVGGFTIRPRRADDDDGTPRTGLWVRYRPDRIVPGAKEEFDARMKEHEAKLAERRALRKNVDKTVAAKKAAAPVEAAAS